MIAIIKYGAGNTQSVMNALDRLSVEYVLSDDPDLILSADRVVLPGVGHAGHAMEALQKRGLDEIIKRVEKPLLGICVGMQLLFEYSEEGDEACLGIIPGIIKKFDEKDIIVPQTGWNTINTTPNPLLAGLAKDAWFYSVHSYYAEINQYTIATSEYGLEYAVAVQKDNYYGTQFHPEKSAKNGQLILKNFISL